MFVNVRPAHSGVGLALLACGVAGLLAVTGCSSGSASPSSGASAGASTPSASTAPSWAAKLGSAATVVPPGTVAPGHSSPGAVLAGLFLGIKDKSAATYCGYAEPSFAVQCKSQLAKTPASQFPTVKDVLPGYAVIDGSKAVVGNTGTLCATAQKDCVTNDDPASVFTTLHSFSALWKNATTPSGTKYSLEPLTKIDGKWYIYTIGG